MRPAATALADQAQAASAEAKRIMAAVATINGTPARYNITPGPVLTKLAGQLEQRALARQITLCSHLSWTAPAPAYWCPYRPGQLRCAACAHRVQQQIAGTAEDRRCDHCRRVVRKIRACIAQLPAIVVDLPPWPLGCMPPVAVLYGLCGICHAADQKGPRS